MGHDGAAGAPPGGGLERVAGRAPSDINRRAGATTGAWPGIQPFGGWKASGTTGKAGGGLYYLQQFMREQSQTMWTDDRGLRGARARLGWPSVPVGKRSSPREDGLTMDGWTGQFLRVNLTTQTSRVESFSEEFAHTWIGGRGFAAKILYDELPPGIDPLGPENKLVVAVGPISGIPAPNTGKTIVAAKSPITGGYGDGNLGTRVTDNIRKAGYDALIVEGRAERPTMLYIEDDRVEFLPADEVWGKGTYETNDWIYAKYGKGVGVLNIGQAGENMVRYAVIRSMEGRSGGRPGMGAVMGSKLLKAIVVKGSKPIPRPSRRP